MTEEMFGFFSSPHPRASQWDSLPGRVAVVGDGQVPHAQMVECSQDTQAAVD